jgi:CubicO group peptidase (beta-lactamase class C family)
MVFSPSDAARLREAIPGLVDEHSLPGIAVGVVSGGALVFTEALGYADIESKTPMTPGHRQRIASITKTMVGLCAMALVDEGRLSLDDRVSDRLPDIAFNGHFESLTVRHLLTHTGGIGETPDVDQLRDPFQVLFAKPGASIAEGYAGGFTIEVPPGSKWAYANHGFFLLGEIISRIEGAPLPEVAARRIYKPLGMSNSDMLDQHHPDLSTGYHRAPGEDERDLLTRAGREVPDEPTVDGINIRGEFVQEWGRGAAGGVQSTIPDMAKYAAALLDRGAGIVRPETFDSMASPQYAPHPGLQAWGLGFAVNKRFGHRTFGHGGNAMGGWNSNLTIFPEENLALMIHVNIAYAHFDKIVQVLRQAVLGVPAFVAASPSVDASLLTSAPGVYEAPAPGPLTNFRIMTGIGRIQVSAREGALVLHARRGDWKQGVRLVPVDTDQPDLLALDTGDPDPPRIAVDRGDDGRVRGLTIGDGQIWYMQRTDKVQPWA